MLKQIASRFCFDPGEYGNHIRDTFVVGLHSDDMLQKLYEQTNLLSQSLDDVLALACTLEGAAISVTATHMVLPSEEFMLLPRELGHVLFVRMFITKSNCPLKGHYSLI